LRELDREYRAKELFGAKEPEEIEAMRQRAEQKVNAETQLIAVPRDESEEYWKESLEKLAEEVVGMWKKRSQKGAECE
jgi:hypothetical protein